MLLLLLMIQSTRDIHYQYHTRYFNMRECTTELCDWVGNMVAEAIVGYIEWTESVF